MKKTITHLPLIILIFSCLNLFAVEDKKECMYVHITAADGSDKVVILTLADIDSIVYYAPVVDSISGIFVDSRDMKAYNWVKIGNQFWMAENLAVNVTNITDAIDGDNASASCGNTDAYVWSNTDASYGKLYSYEAAQKACPTGWHLPSDEEWTTLTDYLTASNHSGTEGTALKSTTDWNSDGNGTDNYGFTALPGGYCGTDGTHDSQGNYSYWWSSTTDGSIGAYCRSLSYSTASVWSPNNLRNGGFSVRCLRD